MEQNQSSAPRLRPPNTLSNTDGWRRTWKSTGKITVRSAKKQERHKNMERKTQMLLADVSKTSSIFYLDPLQTSLSAASQGLTTSHHLTSPLISPANAGIDAQRQMKLVRGSEEKLDLYVAQKETEAQSVVIN